MKKAGRISLLSMFFILAFVSLSHSQYSEPQQVTNNSIDDGYPGGPRINDQEELCWIGGPEGSQEIFFYDGTSITNLSNNDYNDAFTFTEGGDDLFQWKTLNNYGHAVWMGRVDQEDYQIFLYKDGDTTQLTNNDGPFLRDRLSPRIARNNVCVAWYGQDDGGEWDIFLYDGENKTDITHNDINITHNDTWDFNPDINDSCHLVWHRWNDQPELDTEIIFFDGTNKIQLTNNSYRDWIPQINNNDQVVWEGQVGGSSSDWEIFLWDGEFPPHEHITQLTDNAYDDRLPMINTNGQVVWCSQVGGSSSDYEIFLYDGALPPTQITDNSYDDGYPMINDSGSLVWQGQVGGSSDEDSEIFVYDGTSTIQVTHNAYLDAIPQINNDGYVAWTGYDGSDLEIFLAIPDCAADDTDCDGVPDDSDPFPYDSNEWLDTDEDGTGNNTDLDDDDDGMPDVWEDLFEGLDSLVMDADGDLDGDGIANYQEFLDGTDPEDNQSYTSDELDQIIPFNWYDAYYQSPDKEPDSVFAWVSNCLATRPQCNYEYQFPDGTLDGGTICQEIVCDNVDLYPIPAANIDGGFGPRPTITAYLDNVWDNQISSYSLSRFNTVYRGMPHPDRRFEVISRVDDHPTPLDGTDNLESYFFTYDTKDDDNGVATDMDEWVDYLQGITIDYNRPIDTLSIFSHGTPGIIHMSGGFDLEEGEHGFKFKDDNATAQAFTRLKSDGILAQCDSVILLFSCRVGQTEPGKEFVQKLADWSGATVYANSQNTGPGDEGSPKDWSLDVIRRPSDYVTCQTTKQQPVRASDEASFMFPGGLIVEIPAESLASNGTILVTDVTDQAKLELIDTEDLYQAWDILFNETYIAGQATITVSMPLGLDLELADIDISLVSVKYWDVESESWSDLGITNVSVNEYLDIVTFQTSHATTFGIFVEAQSPPEALCQDVTISTEPGLCSASASIDAGSYDSDGDPIAFDQSPAGPYDLGITDVTLMVTDEKATSDTCTATVTIEDQEPPDLSLSVGPDILWPPNHKMQLITPTITASDNCDSDLVIQLKSTTMSEGDQINTYDPNYDSTTGDGNTLNDIEVDENADIWLRAERAGTGTGRIYTISYEAIDSAGNTSTATAIVTVPHDQG